MVEWWIVRWMVAMGFLVGFFLGGVLAWRSAANYAVDDVPYPEWQRALIHAKARQEARELEKKEGK